jgi:hypothetical protein
VQSLTRNCTPGKGYECNVKPNETVIQLFVINPLVMYQYLRDLRTITYGNEIQDDITRPFSESACSYSVEGLLNFKMHN